MLEPENFTAENVLKSTAVYRGMGLPYMLTTQTHQFLNKPERIIDNISHLFLGPNGTNPGEYFADTSQVQYPGTITIHPAWEIAMKIAFYAVIIALALLGNMLVVYIVWRNKHMHTTTNYYIVNLAVSDLMVTTSCTWVHLVDNLTEGWVLGAFFCKLNSFAQGIYSYLLFFSSYTLWTLQELFMGLGVIALFEFDLFLLVYYLTA